MKFKLALISDQGEDKKDDDNNNNIINIISIPIAQFLAQLIQQVVKVYQEHRLFFMI